MTGDLLVSVAPGEIRAGLIQQGSVVELRVERAANPSLSGAIFLGRVQRIASALGGTFVELDRRFAPAYLPGTTLPSGEKLVEGQAIMVQVAKDAFDDKPPEVTAALSITGSLVTLTPQRPGVAVSRQLPVAERARLSEIIVALLHDGEGGIVRTKALGASRAVLAAEIISLRARVQAILHAAGQGTAPCRLEEGQSGLLRLIGSVDPAPGCILIDDCAAFAALRSAGLPVILETDMTMLNEAFAASLTPRVMLARGAGLVIEHTAAFTAVDVNLGAAAGGRGDVDAAIRMVNLNAARSIAAQLRLRQIGGAIVIDFVTMQGRDGRQAVETALAESIASDPVGVQLLGWTRLGHYELTRRRRGPSIADAMLDRSGRKTPETVALEALRAVVKSAHQPGRILLALSPVAAALLQGPLAEFLAEAVVSSGHPIQINPDPGRDGETFDMSNG